MKRHLSSFCVTLIVLVATLCTGCTKTVAPVETSQICCKSQNGSTQCFSISGDELLYLEQDPNGIKMSIKPAKGLMDPTKLGNRSDVEALSAELTQSKAAFTFDPKTEVISWSGDTLRVSVTSGDKSSRIFNTANVMSVVLMPPNSSGYVIGGFLGTLACDDTYVDVDSLVNARNATGGEPRMVVFSEFNGTYYMGSFVRDELGGLTIVTVDPIIIENSWRTLETPRMSNSFELDTWSINRTGIWRGDRNGYYVPISQTTRSYDHSSNVTMITIAPDADVDVKTHFENLNPEKFELVCKIPGKIQIALCDSTFHFLNYNRIVQEIPQSGCAIGIKIALNHLETEIYKSPGCLWSPPVNLPCARPIVPIRR